MIPSTAPCDRGGDGWLMELDTLSGRPLTVSPFDVNGDKNFTIADMVIWSDGSKSYVSGRKSKVGIAPRPTVIRGTAATEGAPKEFKITSGSTGATESIAESLDSTLRRISWRRIVK